jgi:hypothetical protein
MWPYYGVWPRNRQGMHRQSGAVLARPRFAGASVATLAGGKNLPTYPNAAHQPPRIVACVLTMAGAAAYKSRQFGAPPLGGMACL